MGKKVFVIGLFVAAIAMMIFLAGCQNQCPPATSNDSEVVEEVTPAASDNTAAADKEPVAKTNTTKKTTTAKKDVVEEGRMPVVTFKEGDLVDFPNLKVIDPDNDKVTLKFSKPLSEKGVWQTKIGDAGNYTVTITASDGKDTTDAKVLIVVLESNLPPTLAIESAFTANEGEIFKLKPVVADPNKDKVTVTFSGWMKNDTIKIGYDQEGKHTVTVTASDGKKSIAKNVTVTVKDVNSAPLFSAFKNISVLEGEKIVINASAKDAEGDKLLINYSKPLNAKGEWQTKVGDAGEYMATITVSDGKLTDKESVFIKVIMKNHPPVLTIKDLSVKEGETVKLKPTATDADDDKITFKYSGWMKTDTKVTGYTDAGKYNVTVTASDGKLEDSETVVITVTDRNRPPEFVDIV